MHDALYENQKELGPPLISLPKFLQMPAADLTEALERHSFRQKVRADFAGGLKSGVNGTPTFYINGTRHDGSFELEDLVAPTDAALEDIKLQA